MSRTPRILMCPPDYYGIEYEINPWMSVQKGADRPRSNPAQWRALHRTLVELGVEVELLDPVEGLPDLVFTANAGLVFSDLFIPSKFRYKVRQGETPRFEAWFARPGLPDRRTFPRARTSRGPATPCSAATLCSPAIDSAATSGAISGSASDSASRSCRWSWSTPGSTTSTPASARSRRAPRSTTPARSTNTAVGDRRPHPDADRGPSRGGRLLQLQRRRGRLERGPERGGPEARRGPRTASASRPTRSTCRSSSSRAAAPSA